MKHEFEPTQLQEILDEIECKALSAEQKAWDEVATDTSDFENDLDEIKSLALNSKDSLLDKLEDEIDASLEVFHETLSELYYVVDQLKENPDKTVQEVLNDESF